MVRKFSVGGGEGVCHSRPAAPQGLLGARGPRLLLLADHVLADRLPLLGPLLVRHPRLEAAVLPRFHEAPLLLPLHEPLVLIGMVADISCFLVVGSVLGALLPQEVMH